MRSAPGGSTDTFSHLHREFPRIRARRRRHDIGDEMQMERPVRDNQAQLQGVPSLAAGSIASRSARRAKLSGEPPPRAPSRRGGERHSTCFGGGVLDRDLECRPARPAPPILAAGLLRVEAVVPAQLQRMHGLLPHRGHRSRRRGRQETSTQPVEAIEDITTVRSHEWACPRGLGYRGLLRGAVVGIAVAIDPDAGEPAEATRTSCSGSGCEAMTALQSADVPRMARRSSAENQKGCNRPWGRRGPSY